MTELAKEYATAVFDLSKECDKEIEFHDGIMLINDVFKQNPDYVDFLATPGIRKEERLSALENLFSELVPEYVLSFVELICEKGHIRSYSDIAKEFELIYLAYKDISFAEVISAVELTEEQKAKLQAKLEKISGNKVTMDCSVDKSLIGGMIVKMDGTVLDGSLKTRLDDVKEVLNK